MYYDFRGFFMILKKILLLGFGGFAGSNLRYWITLAIDKHFLGTEDMSYTYPWGTFTVNILGCFLLGLLYQAAELFPGLSAEIKMLLGVGLLGALTTFSTFSVETINLLRIGEVGAALGNTLLSCSLGFLAAWLGMLVLRGLS